MRIFINFIIVAFNATTVSKIQTCKVFSYLIWTPRCIPWYLLYFQEEVFCEAGGEALELGLLIGAEDPNPQEEETEMFCFPHLLFQEFVAANYIAELAKVHNSGFSIWLLAY